MNLTEETAKELNDKLGRLLKLLEPKPPSLSKSSKRKTKEEIAQKAKEDVDEWFRKWRIRELKRQLKQ